MKCAVLLAESNHGSPFSDFAVCDEISAKNAFLIVDPLHITCYKNLIKEFKEKGLPLISSSNYGLSNSYASFFL